MYTLRLCIKAKTVWDAIDYCIDKLQIPTRGMLQVCHESPRWDSYGIRVVVHPSVLTLLSKWYVETITCQAPYPMGTLLHYRYESTSDAPAVMRDS